MFTKWLKERFEFPILPNLSIVSNLSMNEKFNRVSEQITENVRKLKNEANELFKKKKYDLAIKKYLYIIEYIEALINDEAIIEEEYEYYIKISLTLASLYSKLGKAYFGIQKNEDAI